MATRILTNKERLERLDLCEWKICSLDEKTLLKIEELTRSETSSSTNTTPFLNDFYRNQKQPSYEVSFSIVLFLTKNREAEGYKFEAFSRQKEGYPWALWLEVYDARSKALHKTFEERQGDWYKESIRNRQQ